MNYLKNHILKMKYRKERKRIDRIFIDNVQKKQVTANVRNTSISDSDGTNYLLFVNAAVSNEEVFSSFRSCSIYRQIVTGLSVNLAEQCWKIIKKQALSDECLDLYLESDKIGEPERYYFDDLDKKVAPSTIRYIKILYDIQKLMPAEINSIAEIGIGYGGQCKIIMDKCNIQRYDLIDLPEVTELAKKYLTEISSTNEKISLVNYVDGTKLEGIADSYDLVISNYAFSELGREVQDAYLQSVILKAKHGYMIWNSLSYLTLGGYSVDELRKIIPNSKVANEEPLSAKDNVLIFW
ncbi:putative sugar O-methyltransferase [Butyrivibrio sp. INlla14]|uniref:putative sugar O-methyltransferase n=1 Tax=Butyrivibrio sp. INlla14 TaxID=1520808 RepID=UPI000876160B|nr:putative sugar O-methyltransferase [Butyrivibrio sp. INlla14]SCX84394.1 putative sugar O-methyltransferase [Butyrivibrio sp. INlla14]